MLCVLLCTKHVTEKDDEKWNTICYLSYDRKNNRKKTLKSLKLEEEAESKKKRKTF